MTGTSSVPAVRFAVAGARAKRGRARLAADLMASGLHVCDEAENAAHGAVVCFERADQATIELVSAANAQSEGRTVAVALNESALTGGAPWELLAAGAADVLLWDGSRTALELSARFRRWRTVDDLVTSPLVRSNLVGEDPAWLQTLRSIVEVARFSAASVLITGESGTGKELAARLIHALDTRPRKGEMVVVDCTTVVPSLSGSEFFGHERGAFTGAISAREGAFALADGGTLFLDEVGELPLPLQAELLRVIQEGVYKPVGSDRWRETTFRLVCATNRDLHAEQARGAFRTDLYYRIAAWVCRLPSLRERRSDVLALARHFLAEQVPEETPELDGTVCEYLLARDYPGNIRDLRQLVTRISHRHVGSASVSVGALPIEERPKREERREDIGAQSGDDVTDDFDAAIARALERGARLKDLLSSTRETAVRLTLEAESGNVRGASRRLGITDRAIHMQRAATRAAQNKTPA
jgi:transcriptional regulator with GAF, ATPase, and Fis domain